MMYRDNSFKVHMNTGNMRLQRQVLFIVSAILLIALVVVSVIAIRNSSYRAQCQAQLGQRMISAAGSAVDEVNRMDSIVTSNTPARLSRVRQYVYCMDQLNDLSIHLSGDRLAENEFFTQLYADLDSLESVIQAGKSSTQDGRTLLLSHLTALRNTLAQ